MHAQYFLIQTKSYKDFLSWPIDTVLRNLLLWNLDRFWAICSDLHSQRWLSLRFMYDGGRIRTSVGSPRKLYSPPNNAPRPLDTRSQKIVDFCPSVTAQNKQRTIYYISSDINFFLGMYSRLIFCSFLKIKFYLLRSLYSALIKNYYRYTRISS